MLNTTELTSQPKKKCTKKSINRIEILGLTSMECLLFNEYKFTEVNN